MTSDWISGVAVLVALTSFVVNLAASRAADRRGRMPVLVVQRLTTVAGHPSQIRLVNVGTGPALNIIFGLGQQNAEGPVRASAGKRHARELVQSDPPAPARGG